MEFALYLLEQTKYSHARLLRESLFANCERK